MSKKNYQNNINIKNKQKIKLYFYYLICLKEINK